MPLSVALALCCLVAGAVAADSVSCRGLGACSALSGRGLPEQGSSGGDAAAAATAAAQADDGTSLLHFAEARGRRAQAAVAAGSEWCSGLCPGFEHGDCFCTPGDGGAWNAWTCSRKCGQLLPAGCTCLCSQPCNGTCVASGACPPDACKGGCHSTPAASCGGAECSTGWPLDPSTGLSYDASSCECVDTGFGDFFWKCGSQHCSKDCSEPCRDAAAVSVLCGGAPCATGWPTNPSTGLPYDASSCECLQTGNGDFYWKCGSQHCSKDCSTPCQDPYPSSGFCGGATCSTGWPTNPSTGLPHDASSCECIDMGHGDFYWKCGDQHCSKDCSQPCQDAPPRAGSCGGGLCLTGWPMNPTTRQRYNASSCECVDAGHGDFYWKCGDQHCSKDCSQPCQDAVPDSGVCGGSTCLTGWPTNPRTGLRYDAGACECVSTGQGDGYWRCGGQLCSKDCSRPCQDAVPEAHSCGGATCLTGWPIDPQSGMSFGAGDCECVADGYGDWHWRCAGLLCRKDCSEPCRAPAVASLGSCGGASCSTGWPLNPHTGHPHDANECECVPFGHGDGYWKCGGQHCGKDCSQPCRDAVSAPGSCGGVTCSTGWPINALAGLPYDAASCECVPMGYGDGYWRCGDQFCSKDCSQPCHS